MSEMKICFVFPSRSRPTKFFNTLDNIRNMSGSKNYFIWAKLDTDDPTMNNSAVIDTIENEYPEVTVKFGKSKNKVHAINRSMEDLPHCDILIIQSDDVIWDVWGFDNEIRHAFEKHFPNLDGTIHYPDDHGKSQTVIVSILGVNLYKKFGYLYNPEYDNVYCDNEFTEVTQIMKKYVFVKKRLFTHAHPIWTHQGWDELYRLNESKETYKKDGDTFFKRKSQNFYL